MMIKDIKQFGIYRKEMPGLIKEIKSLQDLAGDLDSIPDADSERLRKVISILNDRINRFSAMAADAAKIFDGIKGLTGQEIFFLRYVEGVSVQTIAKRMNFCRENIYYYLKKTEQDMKEAGLLEG